MTETTRRRVLASGVSIGLWGLAGCVGSPGRSSPSPTDTPTTTPTAAGTTRSPTPVGATRSPTAAGPAVTDVAIRSDDGSCGEAAGAEIAVDGDAVRVEGTIVAPTPCYEARLESAGEEDRVARFAIGLAPPPGARTCAQCIAEIPFVVTATLAPRAVDRVVVEIGGTDPTTVRAAVA